MTDAGRLARAYSDVLSVEYDEDSGVARIVTLSDCYTAVPDAGQHMCPDREYNDVDLCKHLVALEAARGRLDAPEGWLVVEDLDERTDPEFDVEATYTYGRTHTLGAFEDYEPAADGGSA